MSAWLAAAKEWCFRDAGDDEAVAKEWSEVLADVDRGERSAAASAMELALALRASERGDVEEGSRRLLRTALRAPWRTATSGAGRELVGALLGPGVRRAARRLRGGGG